MKIQDIVFGPQLANSEEQAQKIGPGRGIPMLGLDALSSAAYGPEAALTILIPLGAMGLSHVMPITLLIIGLMFLVYLSYRQTLGAYPNGGGSYTVAKENLGQRAGLLAAAALLIDYILNVAVGISAGVGALVSAIPALQGHMLVICLVILFLLVMINLRGVRESGAAFMLPTYLFLATLLGVIAWGLFASFAAGGAPIAADNMAQLLPATETFSIWLMLRAFASGCTALTGVEAISNGVKVFREPTVKNASRTLSFIIFFLGLLLVGIAYLSHAYQIGATDPSGSHYESLISQLVRAIAGRGIVYYVTMGSVITVLCLSANTSFADFPRLCQILAEDGFLPQLFAERGRRLVFSHGIVILAVLAAALLVFFGGVTDNLIPLFAIGAFLAFTLSQAGMVIHWWRLKDGHSWTHIFVNGLGATATAITLLVVFVSKFSEGAWITACALPIFLFLFTGVKKHYLSVSKQIASTETLDLRTHLKPIALVPLRGWSKMTRKALRVAVEISDEVYAVNIEQNESGREALRHMWDKMVVSPCERSSTKVPTLVSLPNPYRRLTGTFLDFLDELQKKHPNRRFAIVVPNLAEHKWYHWFLHNHRAVLLNAALFLRSDPKVMIVTVPWYLEQ